MPITFRGMLDPQHVLIDVDAGSKKHALQILSAYLAANQSVVSTDDIFEALLERERLGCTAGQAGLAIPHARLPDIQRPHAAMLRLTAPINFDSGNDPDVDLLFGLIAPEASDERDAQRFGRITTHLTDATFTQQLRDAPTADDIYNKLIALDELSDHGTRITTPHAADG